jgi:Zn finger protein HypA/HybF involved in hydrogenase expression
LALTTIQVRKLCKCEACGHVFDTDAEVENDLLVCPVPDCQSTKIVVIGTKVRKNKNTKRRK